MGGLFYFVLDYDLRCFTTRRIFCDRDDILTIYTMYGVFHKQKHVYIYENHFERCLVMLMLLTSISISIRIATSDKIHFSDLFHNNN